MARTSEWLITSAECIVAKRRVKAPDPATAPSDEPYPSSDLGIPDLDIPPTRRHQPVDRPA